MIEYLGGKIVVLSPPTHDSSRRIHLALERDCSGRPSSMHMWSPHDIGRESWVWEEQEALWIEDSPHKVGEEALTEWTPYSEWKRSGPWVKWLLLLKISYYLIDIIVGPLDRGLCISSRPFAHCS